jgi:hypothetical protein
MQFLLAIGSLMRKQLAVCFTIILLASAADPAGAQQRTPIKIDAVRVGFQRLGSDHLFKSGCWTPVYVDVTAGLQGTPKADIVVETDDCDDVRSRYTMALPPLEPKEQFTLLTYTKPGSTSAELTASAVIEDRTVAMKADQLLAKDLNSQIFLAVGSRLPTLRRAFVLMKGTPKVQGEEEGSTMDDGDSPRRLAVLDQTQMMPNRWFAYEPIDVMILTTGNREFITSLINEREGRKDALADWVRRGGRIIVSIGRNQDLIAGLGPIQELLPVTSAGVEQVTQLNSLRAFCSENRAFETRLNKNNPNEKPVPVDVAKLQAKPGCEIETILTEQKGLPLIVRGAYGLGSVTVVAFDLDQPPFTSYLQDLQVKFWNELANLAITAPKADMLRGQQLPGNQRENIDLAAQLEMNLEEFADVPVISFGWVALFILIYIIIVGPLDYFFLKKVLKRLELTWITFPTVVITISVVAYFTAYALKGNDQRINKIDLVDIDLESQRVYGNTWFTIFSPRIQHYTVGLEPLGGVPQANVAGVPNASINLSWMGRPDNSFSGTGRRQSQGLFRRTYDYTPDATGMMGVPIQVWSTKSFESRWETVFSPTQPLVTADLKHPKGKREALSGEIVSHLPMDLTNVALLYRTGTSQRWYNLRSLLPGIPVRVDNLRDGREMSQWANESYPDTRAAGNRNVGFNTVAPQVTPVAIKNLMFQQRASPNVPDNALRYLDQSWRAKRKDEVIVFGRVAIPQKAAAQGQQDLPAEEVAKGEGSLSHLWVGAIPGAGQPRPELLGTMHQEGYVRVIIPIRDENAP